MAMRLGLRRTHVALPLGVAIIVWDHPQRVLSFLSCDLFFAPSNPCTAPSRIISSSYLGLACVVRMNCSRVITPCVSACSTICATSWGWASISSTVDSLTECYTIPSKFARKVFPYLCHGDWLHRKKVRIARIFHLHSTNTILTMIEDQLVLCGDEAKR
jgi:hypothetical protein